MILSASISNQSIAQTKEEKELATAVENFRKAMVDADSIQLNKLVDHSLTYGHSSGFIQHKPQFLHSFMDGSTDFVTIDLQNQSMQIFGNTAIVRHTLVADTNDNNKPGHIKLNIMLVWQKQKKEWKLIARQALRVSE